jgi:hypothetical protein
LARRFQPVSATYVLGFNAGVDGKVADIHGTAVIAGPRKAVTRIKLAVREDVG